MTVSLVLDPEISERDRQIMLADKDVLLAHDPDPAAPRWGGRAGGDVLFALLQAPLWAFLPAVIGSRYRGRVRLAAFAAQALMIGLLVLYGSVVVGGVFLAALIVQPIAFGVLLSRCGEADAIRLARRHQGRYVRLSDLDPTSGALLKRAGAAVRAVADSEVNRAGLLDDVQNLVTLPHQVWDIAQTLAEVSRLRIDHDANRGGRLSPRVAALLAPQQNALALATASVEKRVLALERYADRTRAADDAYREWQVVQNLAERGDDYRDLLARTVRDELAVAEIDGLADQAARIEEALRSSVDQARRAGLALVPDLSEAS